MLFAASALAFGSRAALESGPQAGQTFQNWWKRLVSALGAYLALGAWEYCPQFS